MSSCTYNIAYLQTSLEEMGNYLISADLYGQLHAKAPRGEPSFASLTLGNMLLARQELRTCRLNGEQVKMFKDLDGRFESMRSSWTAAWEDKVRREYSARLRQWRHFLEEFQHDPQKQADRYAYEVRQRVILQLLGNEVQEIGEENRDKLFTLDELLKKEVVEGEFVWDKSIKGGFPRQIFWYLWVRFREGLHR